MVLMIQVTSSLGSNGVLGMQVLFDRTQKY